MVALARLHAAGVEALELHRALDYLETRPEVDKADRVTGRSGGGPTRGTSLLSMSGFKSHPRGGDHDAPRTISSMAASRDTATACSQVNSYGWDYAMVAALVAPRPLLIANTDKDTIFPLEWRRRGPPSGAAHL